MKKFIPTFILLLTIVNGQDRFAKKGKTVIDQKDGVEKMSSTSNQPVPRRISYQGLITKADGSPTDDGSYEILFKVYGTADGGEAVWSENQEVTVNNGIISTILGNTNPFTVIPPEAFLELTVAGSTLSPRQVLTSVFYSVLSDTSAYAKTADYESLSNLPDLDIYVLKDSLENYATSADLYDTLSAYQKLDSNLTDLVEDGLLSASKIEYGISSAGDSGQTWISDGDGAGTWGNPSSIAADDIVIGDGNISIQTINGGISIVPSDGYNITLDSTITIDGNLIGITNDSDLLTFSRDTLTVRGTVMASTIGGFAVLDEDDMASDSELQLATQQSIKAYADSKQSYNENLEAIGSLEHEDGNFLVSNGSEWTVESDSVARASLGLGSIAMLDSDNMDINGGTIDGAVIGSDNPQIGNFTTVQAQSRAYVGDMIIETGSITAESGEISFDDETITTSGTISSGSGSTIGNLTLADGSISSASNQIDFGNDDLSTTGTINTGIATLGSGSTIGNLTFTDGTIASGTENISFGNDNISTSGTLTAGVSTLSSGSEIGDVTISNGSITSSSDAIDFGNDALSTSGTFTAGTATLSGGSTVGNLTLDDGSIISSSDAIDFGNDALSTSGTLTAGTATLSGGSTIGNLTLDDGSITSSSDAIDFGNNTLSTSSTITANSFIGDGSNITGVEASSMGILSGASPITFEGESINDFETTLAVEDPTLSDKTITFPNVTGTIITTGNDSVIDEVGTIISGQWQGTEIADAYVPDDITLSGATIDNSVIGGTSPTVATVTTITTNEGIVPDESDGAYLGTSSSEFSDIFLADGAVINLGDEQDVTLTHIEDTGIKLNGSSQIQFGDSGTQISQSADGVLDLVSDNEIEINGTTIDMNGAVDVSGAISAGSTITTTGSILPSTVDGAGLGSSSSEFSDLFLADGAVVNLGNNQDVTLTHIKDVGIKINDASQIQFGDSGTQISQSADGVLDLVSDNEIEINGATIDMNGAVDISGVLTTASTITATGSLLPAASDGAGLGSSSSEFSDLFLADGAVINLGDNQEVTLTHIEDEGLRLNALSQMQFGDSGTKISQSADGVLDLVSDNEVEINGTTIDINGNTSLENATVDFINIDGTYVGHVDDTDLMNLTNGTVTVSGTLAATTFSGDGSNLTGISASEIKADDISQGDAVVNITTSSGAINVIPASGSPVLIDNTINIDGAQIGHSSDTDLMTLADGSVTFTGTTVIPTADVNGGAVDGVTLGTNSAVTQAVVDNINMDGAQIGHTDDADLMTLANNSVTFTGTTVIPTADVNGGAVDGVTLGTNSAVTQAVIDNVNINGDEIGHTDDTDLMTLADGSVTFTGTTVIPTADVNGGAVDGVTLGTNSAVTQAVIDNVNIDGATIGHTTDTDLITLSSGTVSVAGAITATSFNDITLQNGETISNSTNGDFLLTTDVNDGGLIIKNSSSSNGNSKIELISDNADNAGDGYEIKSVNGTFTITSDHSTGGTYDDEVFKIVGNSNPALTTTTISGDLLVDGGQIALTGDTDLITLSSGVVTVAGELSATTLDINGTDITSTATELNFNDGTSAGTVVASKTVVVDANKDIASFRNITLTGELDAGSLDVSGNADIDGILEADAITVNGSSLASVIQGTTVNVATTGTNVVITDNENTAENNAIVFVADADLDGNSSTGLESDGDLYYNPNTGTLTATAFAGDGSNLTGITASTIGTLTGDNAISFRDTDLAINSSTDGQMDINADVTLDIQAPTTALSGDLTVSGNDISFGNSETISNASDNVIAITSASTTLSGDLTVTGNDIIFGNGETISNEEDGDFLFTTGTANGAFTLKNSNASDGKAAIELVSDNANEVGDGYEIQSLNGVFSITGDHSTSGTYDDTFITVNGNSTPASSYTTIAGDLRVDGGEIGISGDTDLITLASGRATVDGELVVTSLDIGGTDITSTPAELNIIDGNTSATGTTVAGADRVVLNDAGTMVQVAMTDIDTYISGTSKTLTNKTLTSPVINTPTITGNTTFSDGGYNFNIASHDGTNGLALDGTVVTSSGAELNIVDGSTSATGTTVADADRVVLNDAGSMVQVAMTDIDTYISGTSKTLTNKTLTSPVINTPTITGNTTFSDGAYDFNIASHDGTNGLALGGTVVNATADELNTYVLNVSLDDISTASSCYVVAPKAGTITRIYSVIDGTTGTADAVITANVNGGSNVSQTLTIANGSNAGDLDDCTPADNHTVSAGQYIKLTTNGASTNVVSAVFSLVITL